ncbi:MAG TPA: adenylyltransferase/cytidyltransferase family protein [Actinomycetota bacterium]|nr:adenylyltransferase/cytidyltransferase family protein [Actinomycetota bacterium]
MTDPTDVAAWGADRPSARGLAARPPWPEALLEELRRARDPTLVVHPEPGPVATVGLLPGSFDPLTVAHAALAEAARREGAELVVLLYSVRTLPKEGDVAPPLLSEPERLAALERFVRGRPGLAVGVCSHGLLADQAEAAARRFPSSELWVVVGSDKVLQLFHPRWYEDRDQALGRLFGRATVRYAVRAGDDGRVEEVLARAENAPWRDRVRPLAADPGVASVSSRTVRERLGRGEDVRALVPPEVLPVLGRRERPGSNQGA